MADKPGWPILCSLIAKGGLPLLLLLLFSSAPTQKHVISTGSGALAAGVEKPVLSVVEGTRISSLLLPLPVLLHHPQTLGCPILRSTWRRACPEPIEGVGCTHSTHRAFALALSILPKRPTNAVISTGAQRSGETPAFRFCFYRARLVGEPIPLNRRI